MRLTKTDIQKHLETSCLVISLAATLFLSVLQIYPITAGTAYEVKIANFSFAPQNITISLGDTIVWNNTDAVIHTLWFVFIANGTTYHLSDPIPPNTTWNYTFYDELELQYFSFDMLWITGFINITVAGQHDIAITNLTSCYGSTILTQNFTYRVNITVANEGDFAETFTLTLYWNNTNAINSTLISLAISETKVVQLDWNTTGLQRYTNYTLRAYATPVLGETDIADNTFDDPRILMMVYTGDINNDKKVDIKDIASIAKLFGIVHPDPKYNPNMDLDCNGKIDIKDVALAAKQFGYVEP